MCFKTFVVGHGDPDAPGLKTCVKSSPQSVGVCLSENKSIWQCHKTPSLLSQKEVAPQNRWIPLIFYKNIIFFKKFLGMCRQIFICVV